MVTEKPGRATLKTRQEGGLLKTSATYSAKISFVCISLGKELLNRRKSCTRNIICQQRFNSKKKAERYDR